MTTLKLTITLREATLEDVPAMVDVYFDAFHDNPLNQRCFMESSQDARTYWTKWIEGFVNLPDVHLIVALAIPPGSSPESPPAGSGTDSGAPASASASASDTSSILGWARWARRPATVPSPTVLTTATFPSSGENAVAAHFFETAREATERVVAGRDFWFLSMIVTRREAQRRGIGAAMMRFGVELADKEGWIAYLNASKSGRPLYELFGFKVQEHTWFDDLGLDMFHMTRDPRGVNGN